MQRQPGTIDAYIASFPARTQERLQELRSVIHAAAPDAVETISYGMPTFDLNEQHLVHFAGWKQHVSVYPVPTGESTLARALDPTRLRCQGHAFSARAAGREG